MACFVNAEKQLTLFKQCTPLSASFPSYECLESDSCSSQEPALPFLGCMPLSKSCNLMTSYLLNAGKDPLILFNLLPENCSQNKVIHKMSTQAGFVNSTAMYRSHIPVKSPSVSPITPTLILQFCSSVLLLSFEYIY